MMGFQAPTRRLLAPLLLSLLLTGAAHESKAQPRLAPEIAQAGSAFMSRLGNAKSQEEMVALFQETMDFEDFLRRALEGLPAGTQSQDFQDAMRIYVPAMAWHIVSSVEGVAFVPESSVITQAGEQISGQLHIRASEAPDQKIPFSITFARTPDGVKLRDIGVLGDAASQSVRRSVIALTEQTPETPERWPGMILRSLETPPEE